MIKDQLIVVTGATGSQGGSVVDVLLKDGWTKLRGVTRHPYSAAAKKLAAKGVEVVKGAYGAFVVTNFWDPESMGKETEQGRKLVDAAKKEGVDHFVYSSLPNCQKLSRGKYHVPHFTDKALVEDYARAQGFPYISFFGPAFYYSNFINFFPPKKDRTTGAWVYTLPKTSMITMFDVADSGHVVAAIFRDPEGNNGKYIAAQNYHGSLKNAIDILGKATGQPITLHEVSCEQFVASGGPEAKEMADMFGWFNDYTYYGPLVDINVGKRLYPGMNSLENWARESFELPPA